MKKSRRINNWPDIFRKLEKSLREINKRLSNIIVVTFTPTVGDEFQKAMMTPEKALEVHHFIRSELQVDIFYGIGIGVGVGVGDIEKPFNKEVDSIEPEIL